MAESREGLWMTGKDRAAEGIARGQKATYHAATGGSGTRDQPAVGAGIAEADEVRRRPCGGASVAGKALESKVAGMGEAASPRAVSPVPTGQAVARLRSYVGRGRTGVRAWVEGRQRDAAEMADGGGVVEGATGTGGTGTRLAGTPCSLGRTTAVGHQRTRLAGRTQ
jgi:hypothetical protein